MPGAVSLQKIRGKSQECKHSALPLRKDEGIKITPHQQRAEI